MNQEFSVHTDRSISYQSAEDSFVIWQGERIFADWGLQQISCIVQFCTFYRCFCCKGRNPTDLGRSTDHLYIFRFMYPGEKSGINSDASTDFARILGFLG